MTLMDHIKAQNKQSFMEKCISAVDIMHIFILAMTSWTMHSVVITGDVLLEELCLLPLNIIEKMKVVSMAADKWKFWWQAMITLALFVENVNGILVLVTTMPTILAEYKPTSTCCHYCDWIDGWIKFLLMCHCMTARPYPRLMGPLLWQS